ncbi:MAG: rod shape-determining protein MreC [candidate division WOR-3 bacterium]|nr:rod shape-determining protein MreC [candidate division WOR-3 bacterium]
MRRQQIILFILLFIVSTIPVLLSENTNLNLARDLSSFLLFPFRITTAFVEYLAISNTRIEKLETIVNQLKLENATLKDQLVVDTTNLEFRSYILLKASVVGRDPLNINGYLHIDRGTVHGVSENQTVLSVDGFVGKIRHVGPSSSIVETIENRGFTVSAIDVSTGIHGIVKKQENLMFLYIRHNDAIGIGDSITTSGMSEIFPKGILIGNVHTISESEDMFFKNVYITPASQINRLVSVYVVQDTLTNPARN